MDFDNPITQSFSTGLAERSVSMELVERIRSGDRAAIGELLELHQDRLRRIVRARIGRSATSYFQSMDIVQQTYLVACRKLPDFKPRGPGSTLHWLGRLAERQILDAMRWHQADKRDARQNRSIDVRDSAGEQAFELPGRDMDPGKRLDDQELAKHIDEAVQGLTEQQREVVLLRWYCGETDWRELADELGNNVKALKQLERRAMMSVAEHLQRRGYG